MYAVLHSEVVGQKPNLTSYYLRAFRFAKRCLGGRRGGPPFGDGSCVDSRPSLAAAGADASLRAGWLGWLIGLSVGADDLGGPNPRPSSIVKRTDSHVGPLGLLGMTTV